MKILFYSILFFCSLPTINAQQLGLQVKSFPGLAYKGGGGSFYGGGGFELQYQHDFGNDRLRGGLEYRMVDWGNQTGLNLGYNMTFWERTVWRVSGTSGIQLGLALFRSNPLFAWSLEYSPEIEWQSAQRFFANLSLGLRYTNSPKYKNFGSVNAVFELPVTLGFGFRLGKREKKEDSGY